MVQPFAGQPPQAVSTTAYPVTQRPNPKVNTDGSINTEATPVLATLTPVVVNATASGDNTVLAGAANKTIKVYKAALSSTESGLTASYCTMTFKSGSITALSGPFPLLEGQPLVLPFDGTPWFTTTNSTDAFVLNLTTTASVGGTIYVVQS